MSLRHESRFPHQRSTVTHSTWSHHTIQSKRTLLLRQKNRSSTSPTHDLSCSSVRIHIRWPGLSTGDGHISDNTHPNTHTPTQRERRVHLTCHTPSSVTSCLGKDTCPPMSRAGKVYTTSARIRAACVDTVLNGGKTMIPARVVASPDPSAADVRR
jgi:hypothetical protein